jgi:hypothetical protein
VEHEIDGLLQNRAVEGIAGLMAATISADRAGVRVLVFSALAGSLLAQSPGPIEAYLQSCHRSGEDGAPTQKAFAEVVPVLTNGSWAKELDVMAAALKHTSAPVRLCAASLFSLVAQSGQGTVARLNPAIDSLFRALRDPEGLVQFGAAMALANLRPVPPPVVANAILRWVPHLDGGTQAILLTGLARIHDPTPEVITAFVSAIRAGPEGSSSPLPQSGALAGLADNRWRHAELMAPVIEALASEDRLNRILAAKVLIRYGPAAAAALPQLRRNLEDPELLPAERADLRAVIAALAGPSPR